MADARILHEIVKALRALQSLAIAAGSPEVDIILAEAVIRIYDKGLKAEKADLTPARTIEEMMRRLGDHSGS